jgi:lipoprotein-releasing system ATP-binding protein
VKNIVEINKLHKSYFTPVETKVLKGVDLDITKGGITSIVGQSGSGKSTLMNIIGALDTPTSGQVIIKGNDISKMRRSELAQLRNQTIGFVFQFHYLLPEFNVMENVLLPKQLKNGNVSKKDQERAKELLDLVGLSDRIYSKSTQISGGQQQRTAIARALMNQPDIILADEPTGNLDSNTSAMIFKLFCKINLEFKTTFIIITHDDRIAQEANNIIEIKDGIIVRNDINPNPACIIG